MEKTDKEALAYFQVNYPCYRYQYDRILYPSRYRICSLKPMTEAGQPSWIGSSTELSTESKKTSHNYNQSRNHLNIMF